MNTQMPNYMPPFNMDLNNDFRKIEERINELEKKVRKLEKKVEILENNKVYPMPFNIPNFPNNYMM